MLTLGMVVPTFSALHVLLGVVVMSLAMAFLILIHEMGHWIVARVLGFKTPVFSIGFGRRQWSKVLGKFWGTEFRLAPILAGGFVDIPELHDHETAKAMLLRRGITDEPAFFPVWKRIAVALAGVTFNLIGAVVMLTLLFCIVGSPTTKIESTSVQSLTATSTIAREAGLQPGDTFVSVAGARIITPDDLHQALKANRDQVVNVVVRRGSDDLTLTVRPNQNGQIGIVILGSGSRVFIHVPLTMAVVEAATITKLYQEATLNGLGMMLHIVPRPAEVAPSDLEVRSIVGIVKEGASAYGLGVFDFVMYLALISVNLVVLNLLPLPILDGGHVVFLLWEKLRGKPANKKLRQNLGRFCLYLLAALFLLGLFNDFKHIIIGH
jgi:regulator of sigma E protease